MTRAMAGRVFLAAALLGGGAALAADAIQPAQGQTQAQGARVTVGPVRRAELVERIVVTGTLAPREEILVGSEIDGFRVIEVLAEEGDRVTRGQVLARLNRDTLDALVAQNDAAVARADAAIAQAKSQIATAEAMLNQSRQAFERANQLKSSGFASQAVFDQVQNDERANRARLEAAKQGLAGAEADKASTAAQRRELLLRQARTEVKAPADGVVSRRTAKVGAVAAMNAEPMFRLIAGGEVELEAEVSETRVGVIKPGAPALVSVGDIAVPGKVRLVATEIDRLTRMGKVRVALGPDSGLRIGAFARGSIEARRSAGLAVPLSAVLYSSKAAFVQVVKDNRVVSTPVDLGIIEGQQVEVIKGLVEGDVIVLKAGAFLRDGDAVSPQPAAPQPVSQGRAP